jgi:DNA-binding CsgD family transcriptional regulator
LEHGGTAGVRDGRIVANYLQQFGIAHLMLCGIDSSFGLAWVTLYRRGPAPFDNDDVEKARYIVPALVYAWQRNTNLPRQWDINDMPMRLLPLTFGEMRIAILVSKGTTHQAIADQIGVTVNTVRKVVQNIRDRLGVSNLMLEAFEESRREG